MARIVAYVLNEILHIVDAQHLSPIRAPIPLGTALSPPIVWDGRYLYDSGGFVIDLSTTTVRQLSTDLPGGRGQLGFVTTWRDQLVAVVDSASDASALGLYSLRPDVFFGPKVARIDATVPGLQPENSLDGIPSGVSQDGWVFGSEEALTTGINLFTGAIDRLAAPSTDYWEGWNNWPGFFPQFNEGTENNAAGPGGGSRSNSPVLDMDAAAPQPYDANRTIYWIGFNESTNIERDLLQIGPHNFYFAKAPIGNLNAWQIAGSGWIPELGEFPSTYPYRGNSTLIYPYYFYATGSASIGGAFRWNVLSGQSDLVTAGDGGYATVWMVDAPSGEASQLSVQKGRTGTHWDPHSEPRGNRVMVRH